METLTKNSENLGYYKTTSLSTIGELEDCDRIALCLTKESEKLNLDKLNNAESLEELLPNSKYLTIDKAKKEEVFVYNRLNILDNPLIQGDNNLGFDTIIYLNYKNRPIGYTEFTYTQGIMPEELIIKLKFNVENSDGKEIKFSDNLDSILTSGKINNKLKTLLNSDKLYGLTTIKRVNEELKKAVNIYPRYTKNVSELLSDPEMNTFLDFGICSSEGLYKLNLIKEMTIAEDFKNHQLGYYKGEIVLYSWKKDSEKYVYSIYSLSRRDKFGNPICYTNTTSGTKEIKNHDNGIVSKVRYFSGKYISVTIKSSSGKGDFYAVYNIDTDDWVQLDSVTHVMDLWGIDSRIVELPNSTELSTSTFSKFCPDIVNTFLDIENYTYKPFDVEKKIGEWYVLNQTRQSESTKYKCHFKIYTNMTKVIVLSNTLLNNTSDYIDEEPLVINNNLLALRTKTKYVLSGVTKNLDYYTYFVGDGIYYSENALFILNKLYSKSGEMCYPNNLNPEKIKTIQDVTDFYNIQATDSESLLSMGIEPNVYHTKSGKLITNYGTNLLIDHISNSFTESYISGFRRNTCPTDLLIPELIGSINGLTYYKTKDNKIKLL